MSRVQVGSINLPSAGAFEWYLRVKLAGGVIAVASSTEDEIGVLEDRVMATDAVAAVIPRADQATRKGVASEPITKFALVYAAAGGKLAASGTLLRGVALVAASGNNSIIEYLPYTDGIAGNVLRTNLIQEDLAAYPVPVRDLRVWDAPSTVAVAATAANDDLAVVYNTHLTLPPTVEAGDLKSAGATTRKVGFQFVVPPEYVAGQTATLRCNAGMKTTVADTAAIVDFLVARQAAPTVDICATAAQSINNLVAANKDFVLTPTDLVPGDVLDVVCVVTVTDAAGGAAVIAKINSIALLLDIKG